MKPLAGRVALVTGASGGIGQSLATALAHAGATVAIHYGRHGEAARYTLKAVEAQGSHGILVSANLEQEGAVQAMVETVLAHYRRLDILVNNAGITRDGLLIHLTQEFWDEVLNTNLRGAFYCAKYALRPMIRQKSGTVINISSISGVLGNAGQANYAAAKAGLIGLTHTIAQEYAAKGITANAVVPGIIDTAMTRAVRPQVVNDKLQAILLRRAGTPDEVSQAVVLLAQNAYINGAVLRIDGGIRF
ncbi:3-oxoacyl-ACP reductase FabG [Sulfobacillus thermosulfidooxidans]|uniref:3-oxoacyl-ACP reductase FabG n=1 Tax=Sulfobacillus thermosulfidooxidans TaxID=28034 RepID=UPI0006B4863F|nr:3-oxoacyl-ACP reductase FabG [Sulfobacillus thermosulfidooxidans]